MKIWIISLFDPVLIDGSRPMRFLPLATYASNNNIDVIYFSNTFRHSTKKFRKIDSQIFYDNKNLRTIFINSISYKKNISFLRLFSHYVYAVNFFKFIKKLNEKPDIIISALPPLYLNYKLSKFSRKNNISFFVDIIDPWPDVFKNILPLKLSFIMNFILFPFDRMLKITLNNSDGIISLSEKYIKWSNSKIKKTDKKNIVIYPSIDFENYRIKINYYKELNRTESKNLVKLVYAGNLGKSYDIPCILNAAILLEKKYQSKYIFYLAGSGYYKDMILKYQNEYSNINYLGRLEYEDLMKLYSECDFALAQYSKRSTQSITYKFFDYLGAGLPILNSLPGEMAELIEKNNLGLNNSPGNYKQLAENIIHLSCNDFSYLKTNAINFCKKFGDNSVNLKKYLNFVLN